jgi:PAS domain S-box-containing protein
MVYKAIIETEAGAIYTDMTQLKRTQSALLHSTTELSQSEKEAQRSLAELKTIYGTTPVGLCFLDTDLRYQAVSEELAKMNGLPVEQHQGKSIHEVLTVGNAAHLEGYLRQVLETGHPVVNLELSARSMPEFPDNRYLLSSFHPALDDDGCMLGISCVIQDITEQKRAEMALESSERTLKLFIEYAPTAIAMLDRQMCYIVASRRYLEDYRLGNQDLAGRSHYEIFPEIPERWKEIHRRCLAGSVEKSDEDIFPRSDGSVDWVRWETRPWFDHHGTIGGIILFSEVISQRKQAEEELAEAHSALQAYAQKLKRSNQELEQFAFVASHDLQEPLRKIRFFGRNLQQQFTQDLPAEARDYLERMQNAAERMRTMIDGLLELSRVSTRGGNFVLVDLTTVVEEAIADLEARIRTSGGEVILDSLPSVEIDVVQIRQLFQNLIGNALKFHKPGVPPVVHIYQGPLLPGTTISQVDIMVEDNGIGFNEQFTDRIFQPFQRLHGKSEFEGTGLGLAISQKIVERHHGKLKVRSVLNEGSVFTVTLPIRQSASLRASLPD